MKGWGVVCEVGCGVAAIPCPDERGPTPPHPVRIANDNSVAVAKTILYALVIMLLRDPVVSPTASCRLGRGVPSGCPLWVLSNSTSSRPHGLPRVAVPSRPLSLPSVLLAQS